MMYFKDINVMNDKDTPFFGTKSKFETREELHTGYTWHEQSENGLTHSYLLDSGATSHITNSKEGTKVI